MAHVNNRIQRTVILTLDHAPEHGEEIIGDAVRKLPGVDAVQVQTLTGRLLIDYDPGLTSPTQFLNLARQAGYKADLSG